MIGFCFLPRECGRYWFKVVVQTGRSSELTLILPADCANQRTALLELSMHRRLNQQTRKMRNFRPLNVREILCSELLLDLKSELCFLHTAHTIFWIVGLFWSLYLSVSFLHCLSAIETVPDKRVGFFVIETGSFPRKVSMNWHI